ncbi:MAG TPA: hypothetical protein VFW19_09615 [Allosphingosinicella sp.]|nr:hypothetical protein [Allosphingosinicella sp.]
MNQSRTREWKVQFMVPEAEMNGVARYLCGAWMAHGGVPGPAGTIGSLMEGGMRLLYNGLPITGKLSANREGVRFEPNDSFFEDLFYDSRPSVFIPSSDIVDVDLTASFLGVPLSLRVPSVIITTTNGKLYVKNQAFLGRNRDLAEYVIESVGCS